MGKVARKDLRAALTDQIGAGQGCLGFICLQGSEDYHGDVEKEDGGQLYGVPETEGIPPHQKLKHSD
jgi:hypothetical protein